MAAQLSRLALAPDAGPLAAVVAPDVLPPVAAAVPTVVRLRAAAEVAAAELLQQING